MPNPWLSAQSSDLETFLRDYDPAVTPQYATSSGMTALFGATGNRDPQSRAAIAERLLDDGADPRALTQSGGSPVHALLEQRNLRPTDAPVLARLLEGGADVNLPNSKKSVPLAILYNNYTARDSESGALYDVLFSQPGLDLDGPASRANTFRQLLEKGNPEYKPDFRRRVAEYEAAHGVTA